MTVSCVYIMHFDHTHPPPYSLPMLADSFLNSVFGIVGTKSHFVTYVQAGMKLTV